ncbi:cupin domain-containing protein [Halomonas nitroreducens]|uniref:Cupin domain-containing protein n=1 Tax=Halomonas nitroreducens TaxID=447425 RepID=A0A3S0KTH9_9GAMM|nr:cupin domain-containing protein [Halomonas nitroreducens]RTR06940.1 cupin domain-containing protein [Halomonas nitroreducens]
MNLRMTTAWTATALVVALGTPMLATGDSTQLMKTELQGVEGMEVNIVDYDVGPDWVTDRHIHPGHVFVYVTEGSLEVAVEGKEPRTIMAGEVFYERPDQPMVGRTVSAEGAKFTLFQIGSTGEPLTVSQPE